MGAEAAPRPAAAAGYMLLSVFAVSAYGALFGLTGGAANPVLWVGLWQLGAAICYWFCLRLVFPPLAGPGLLKDLAVQVWSERRLRWLLAVFVASTADAVLYGAAARLSPLVVVLVIFDTWPVWSVLLLAWLQGCRLRALAGRLTLAGGLGVAGSFCVVSAQLGGNHFVN